MFGREWESEEVALLRTQQKLGVSLRETARQLGRGYAAVKSFASDHGILKDGNGKWSPADDACLLVLGRQGMSADEIGQMMGRSERAVRQRLVRLELKLSHLRALGPLKAP